MIPQGKEYQEKTERMARQALGMARDDLLLHMRFFAAALHRLKPVSRPDSRLFSTDGEKLYYDPMLVLSMYGENPVLLSRTLLHSVLHCLFAHPFRLEGMDREKWEIAADAAVEAVILSLGQPALALKDDGELQLRFKGLRQVAGGLTAERIYNYFCNAGLPSASRVAYLKSFTRDDHRYWGEPERLELTQQQWEQLSRRIRTEVKAFSKERSIAEALSEGLSEATRRHYDYGRILARFMSSGEYNRVSMDEFDQVYYSYGLSLYGNLPLIEALEYREDHRIRDLAIAIDTSASVSGDTVKSFVRRSFELLKSADAFFEKVNIHLIQCDSEVESDTVINDTDALERFLDGFTIRGFGGTDFRPVFHYVDRLCMEKRFTELKGLIYFTDGYGIYPEKQPPYRVLFVFPKEDDYRPELPLWAEKVILE